MSQRKGHSARTRGDARHEARGLARRVWFLAAVLVIAAGWWLWRRNDTPALPAVSTIQLDASSARQVQQHLDEVRRSPRSGAAWGRLGALLRSFEFRAEARRCFDVAGRLDPKNPRWPYFLGLMLATESPVEGIEKLRRAVALCGHEPETPRLHLARLLAESGRADEATRELRELLRDKPDYTPASLALAHLAQARGDLTNAASLARRSTADRRTARAAWTLLSMLYQRLGDTNELLNAKQRASAVPPDAAVVDPFEAGLVAVREDARDLSDRAQRFLMAGQLQDATPLVDQLIPAHPQFAESWLLLGRLQVLNRQPVAAEQSLRRHLQLDAESINGHFQLGMALLAQERFTDAAETFRKATRLKADFGPAWFHLGMALARGGRQQEAIAPFREAIRHNPERVDSYILLADLLLQLGRKTEAMELARQAELVSPNDRRLPTLREKLAREP
jgi:tetratricopeptide (TPR) repeat protein